MSVMLHEWNGCLLNGIFFVLYNSQVGVFEYDSYPIMFGKYLLIHYIIIVVWSANGYFGIIIFLRILSISS